MDELLVKYRYAVYIVNRLIEKYKSQGEDVKIIDACTDVLKQSERPLLAGDSESNYLREVKIILSILFRRYYFSEEDRERMKQEDELAISNGIENSSSDNPTAGSSMGDFSAEINSNINTSEIPEVVTENTETTYNPEFNTNTAFSDMNNSMDQSMGQNEMNNYGQDMNTGMQDQTNIGAAESFVGSTEDLSNAINDSAVEDQMKSSEVITETQNMMSTNDSIGEAKPFQSFQEENGDVVLLQKKNIVPPPTTEEAPAEKSDAVGGIMNKLKDMFTGK